MTTLSTSLPASKSKQQETVIERLCWGRLQSQILSDPGGCRQTDGNLDAIQNLTTIRLSHLATPSQTDTENRPGQWQIGTMIVPTFQTNSVDSKTGTGTGTCDALPSPLATETTTDLDLPRLVAQRARATPPNLQL